MMNRYRLILCIGTLLVGMGLLAGCDGTAPTEPESASQDTPSPAPNPTSAPLPSATAIASPTPEEALPVTHITVDGKSDDWGDRSVFDADPTGDSESGFDLTNAFAFVNAHAFYFLVEADDPTEPFVMLDMFIEVDNRSIQITWSPGDEDVYSREWLDGNPLDFQLALNSRIVFDDALEARLDLDDLGNPDLVRMDGIAVIVESGGEAIVADTWRPTGNPRTANEVDPKRVHSNEEPYFLARRFGLPEGLIAEQIFAPPGYVQAFARSQDGKVFFQSRRFDVIHYIGVLEPLTGEQTHLLDLPIGRVFGEVIGGPSDTVLIQVEDEVWQIRPDGSYEIWGKTDNAIALYFAPDGRLLGTPGGEETTLVEIHKDGSQNLIASGFEFVFAAAARSDGTIAVYDDGTGSIYRIDPDGSKHGLMLNTFPGENRLLILDFDESLYSFIQDDLIKIDWTTGSQTAYSAARFRGCIGHFAAGFLFFEGSRVLMVGDQFGWWDLETGESGLIQFRGIFTPAADIGPDGNLYIGTPACGDEYPGEVVQITSVGESEVMIDNLPGRVWDIDFDTQGGLYLASGRTDTPKRLFYKPPESDELNEIPDASTNFDSLTVDPDSGNLLVSHTSGGAVIMEYDENGLVRTQSIDIPYGQEEIGQFHIASSPDGNIYAYAAADLSTSKPYLWILRVNLDTGSTEIVAEFLRETPGGGMGSIFIDETGDIWLLVSPDSLLYRVTSGGEVIRFAEHLPIDTPAVAVNASTGDIYFTHNSGIFRIYREP